MTREQFKSIRLALGLSQSQLAVRLGLTTNTIQNYESGRSPISGPVAMVMRGLCNEMATD